MPNLPPLLSWIQGVMRQNCHLSPSYLLSPIKSRSAKASTALEALSALTCSGQPGNSPAHTHFLKVSRQAPTNITAFAPSTWGWVLMSQLVELNFLDLPTCPPRSPHSEPVHEQLPTQFPFLPPQFFPVTAGAEVVCLRVSIEAAVRLFAFGLDCGKPPGPSSPSIWLRGLVVVAVAIGISHAEMGW